MDEIDFDGPTPIHVQITEVIKERIESGIYRKDRPLPSIVQLSQEFGCSKGTARRVLSNLVDAGLARSVSGRGTYVR